MRAGSTRPSHPRHHWTFQVMSFIRLPFAGPRLQKRKRPANAGLLLGAMSDALLHADPARQSSSPSPSNRSRFASALPEKFSIPTTITPSAGVAANSAGLIVSGTEARERGPTTANAPVLTALLNALNLPAFAAPVPSAFPPRKSQP